RTDDLSAELNGHRRPNDDGERVQHVGAVYSDPPHVASTAVANASIAMDTHVRRPAPLRERVLTTAPGMAPSEQPPRQVKVSREVVQSGPRRSSRSRITATSCRSCGRSAAIFERTMSSRRAT